MEQEKQQFEAWVKSYLIETPDFRGAKGRTYWYYFSDEVEDMWRAWQARATATMKEEHGC
jgi:hypothetical protein